MKTISELTGVVTDAEFNDRQGAPAAVYWENPECKGTFAHIFLGPSGVRVRSTWKQGGQVVIPLEAILALVKQNVPEMFPTAEECLRMADMQKATKQKNTPEAGK